MIHTAATDGAPETEVPEGRKIFVRKNGAAIDDDDDDIGEINANIGHLNPLKGLQPVVSWKRLAIQKMKCIRTCSSRTTKCML